MARFIVVALAASLVFVATAAAQLGLPPLPGGGLPGVPGQVPGQLGNPVESARSQGLKVSTPRLVAIRALVDSHPDLIDVDPRGAPIVRGEVLAIAPSPESLDKARAAGFLVIRETALDGLGLRIVTLKIPAGMSARRALKALRRLDREAIYDFNHVYTRAGDVTAEQTDNGPSGDAAASNSAANSPRIGLLDAGIDSNHPAFGQATIQRWGCDGQTVPSPHGTAVASLLVGRAPGFTGVLPSAALYAADVYCGQPTGGNVLTLAAAFAWLAREGVRVVNVSLVGPPDATLERVISRLLDRGVQVVAAVGNDGPRAPALYPAAYPGVVGVTGVDARRRVLIEAGRGPQVSFAAPGAEMAAAGGGAGYVAVRGTSFAAPLVAGLLARELGADGPDAARSRLADAAIDLGRRGRDDTYGAGLVGEQYRVTPEAVAPPGTIKP